MKHVPLRKVITFLAIVPLSCVSLRSIRYEDTPRNPRPDYPVEILESKDVYQPYKVIGLVEVSAGKWHNLTGVMERLKDAARKMGGQALVDLRRQAVGTGVPISQDGTTYLGYVRELWSAKVIVWEVPR